MKEGMYENSAVWGAQNIQPYGKGGIEFLPDTNKG